MLFSDVIQILPSHWYKMDLRKEYAVFGLMPYSHEYEEVKSMISGNYYETIDGIYKIQNPILYAKFHLRAQEYQSRGPFEVKRLFHDSLQQNAGSICQFNLDWRFGYRYKHGYGVYFADTAANANHLASKKKCYLRSMFIVDVLVQNCQSAYPNLWYPDFGYDTVVNGSGNTYVKYNDCDYYPVYVVNYKSRF